MRWRVAKRNVDVLLLAKTYGAMFSHSKNIAPVELVMKLDSSVKSSSENEEEKNMVEHHVDGIVREEWVTFYNRVMKQLDKSGIRVATVKEGP